MHIKWPWLVWLSGLSTSLQTKGLLVQFPVRIHSWVAGCVPGGWHTLVFLSLSFPISKNRCVKSLKNKIKAMKTIPLVKIKKMLYCSNV